jgi:hypothetical protein
MRKTLVVVIMLSLVLTGISLYAADGEKVDAKALFEKKCSLCHSLDRPRSEHYSEAEWKSTVARMKKNGCSLTDEETKTIIKYLTENYGK